MRVRKTRKETISFVMSVLLSVSLSVCLSVRPSACSNSAWIFARCDIGFSKSVAKIQVSLKSDKNNGYEDQYTFMIISQLIILKMREFSDKTCGEIPNTNSMLSNFFFFYENRAVYEVMWENMVDWGRSQMTTWHIHIACHIPNATNAHSECVMLITFPLQQWLHKPASILRHVRTLPVLHKISTL